MNLLRAMGTFLGLTTATPDLKPMKTLGAHAEDPEAAPRQSEGQAREGGSPMNRWKARRSGSAYCAPACVHGCQRKDYEAALLRSKLVADDLSKGWRAEVMEIIEGSL